MPDSAPIYDLVLLLSNAVADDRRAKILGDVESAITSGGGSVERNDDWGTRNLAYQINHQPDAEYHLLQFSGPVELLESLSHSLKISDGVLRFRIIKVIPGMPAPPDIRPAAPAAPAQQQAPQQAAPASEEEPAAADTASDGSAAAPEPAAGEAPAENEPAPAPTEA